MNEWQERFLAGLFTTWFASRRKHPLRPDKFDKEAGAACAESARFTFNALLRTARQKIEWEIEPNEPKHENAWGVECWCGETHNTLSLVK